MQFPRGGDVVMTAMRYSFFGIAANNAGKTAAPYLLPARFYKCRALMYRSTGAL